MEARLCSGVTVISAVLLILAVGQLFSLVHAQAVQPTEVYQFTVSGVTNSGSQLTGTQDGVYFEGLRFNVWQMFYWNQAYNQNGYSGAYVVAMVNITSGNFDIIYMYLRNGYSTLNLFLFDYNIGGGPVQYQFTGTQTVGSSTTYVYPAAAPTPTFIFQPKFSNQVSLQSSAVSLQGNTGTYNGETVYVVWNYLDVVGTGSDSWNEIWAVASNYHFIVFYTYFSSPGSVTVNDVDMQAAHLTQKTYPASWSLIQPQAVAPQSTSSNQTVTTTVTTSVTVTQNVTQNQTNPVPEFDSSNLTVAVLVATIVCAEILFSRHHSDIER